MRPCTLITCTQQRLGIRQKISTKILIFFCYVRPVYTRIFEVFIVRARRRHKMIDILSHILGMDMYKWL